MGDMDYLYEMMDRTEHKKCSDYYCQLDSGHDRATGRSHCRTCWEDWPCPEAEEETE